MLIVWEALTYTYFLNKQILKPSPCLLFPSALLIVYSATALHAVFFYKPAFAFFHEVASVNSKSIVFFISLKKLPYSQNKRNNQESELQAVFWFCLALFSSFVGGGVF